MVCFGWSQSKLNDEVQLNFDARVSRLISEQENEEAVLTILNTKEELDDKTLLAYLQNAKSLAKEIGKDSLMARSEYEMARIYRRHGEYGGALLAFLNANRYFKNNDEIQYAFVLSDIAELFFILEEFPTALEYYRKSLNKKKAHPYVCNLPFAYWCMAEVHYALFAKDSAQYYYTQSSKSADTIRGIPYYGNEGMAQILIDEGEYLRALKMLVPVEKWYKESGMDLWNADMGLLYMEAYLELEAWTSFKEWSTHTKYHAFNLYLPEQQVRYYKLQYNYLLLKGDTSKALFALEQAFAINEELEQLKGRSSLASILIALKDKDNELSSIALKNEKQNNELLSQRSKTVKSIVLFLLLISIISAIAIISIKLKNKNIVRQLSILGQKEKQIQSMRMKSKTMYALMNLDLIIMDMNESFAHFFEKKADLDASILTVFSEHEKAELMQGLRELKDFEKLSFNWKGNEAEEQCVEFILTNCLNDPSVNGYLIEARDLTYEYRSHETEKKQLKQSLKEKEDVLTSTHQKVAMTNLQLALKNEVFNALGSELNHEKWEQKLKKEDLKKLLSQVDHADKHWKEFTFHFDMVHTDFFKHLHEKFKSLTTNDERHAVFLKLRMTNKEVANVLGITPDAVKKARQRLRKKLQFETTAEMKEYMAKV